MKIQAFGCTHGFHENIKIEEGIDMLIHTGDASNYRDPSFNSSEMLNFLDWYEAQDVKYKLFVAGNHDTSIEKRLITSDDMKARGIIYLENTEIIIEGIKIFGSPYTPNFCNWAFMKDRSKLDKVWKQVTEGTDIIISHGPPRFILDLTENRDGSWDVCGDISLLKNCERVKPKHVFFSHIHDRGYIKNRGTKIQEGVQYHNVNCVEDGKFDKGLQSNGLIVTI